MKNNRANRPSNKNKFRENNRDGIYAEAFPSSDKILFDEIPESKLQEVKAQIWERAKAEKAKQTKAIFISLILTLLICLMVFLFL